MKCEKVWIRGRVQGVCFRYYAQMEAERLGIRGWVRNLPDGSVAALICGDEKQLAAMRAWLSHGPPMAQVEEIRTEVYEGPCPGGGFRIKF